MSAQDPDEFIQSGLSGWVLNHTTPRERGIAIGAATVGLVSGAWLGLWSIPEAALHPVLVENQSAMDGGTHLSKSFQPVPSFFPALSVLGLVIGLWVARWVAHGPDETDGDEPEGSA